MPPRPAENQITVTDADLLRLGPVLEQHGASANARAVAALEAELQRAKVVPQRAVPSDVVTMNSELIYEDLDTGERRTIKIVYPHDADAAAGKISVLAPIGCALLGLSVGQSISWPLPSGRTRRVRVVELTYQPEAAGDYER